MTFNDQQVATIYAALEVAGEAYLKDARTVEHVTGLESLVKQFKRQQLEAFALMAHIENQQAQPEEVTTR